MTSAIDSGQPQPIPPDSSFNCQMNRRMTTLADSGSDDELREMAEMEIAEAEEKLPGAERDMMIALIPPDPTDR